jgi:hypothetical protein
MKTCTNSLLAKSGSFRVDHCSCGTINLHLGAVSMRLDPQALMQLTAMLNTASARYQNISSQPEDRQDTPAPSASNTTFELKDFLHLNSKRIKDIH